MNSGQRNEIRKSEKARVLSLSKSDSSKAGDGGTRYCKRVGLRSKDPARLWGQSAAFSSLPVICHERERSWLLTIRAYKPS